MLVHRKTHKKQMKDNKPAYVVSTIVLKLNLLNSLYILILVTSQCSHQYGCVLTGIAIYADRFCVTVLQQSDGSLYTVLVDLVKCGLTDSRTCLRAVTLALGSNAVVSFRHRHINSPGYISNVLHNM